MNNNTLLHSKYIKYIVIIIIIIICIIIISVVLIRGITEKNKNDTFNPIIIGDIRSVSDIKKPFTHTIPSSLDRGQYSISMWLYIKNYNFNLGVDKIIIKNTHNGVSNN